MRRIFWKVKQIIVIGSISNFGSNFGVPVTLFLASRNYLRCGLCVWRVAPSSGLVGFQDKHSKVSLSPSDVYTKSHLQWTLFWTLSVLGRPTPGDGKGGFAAVSFPSPGFLWRKCVLSKNWNWSTR